MNTKNIVRLFNVVDRSLFTILGRLEYDRLTDAIIKLADTLNEVETDESIWYIGEFGACCLDDLIIGAYWHYTEWHGGQNSKGYAALCALGQIFEPNMSSVEEENLAYQALNELADKTFNTEEHGT